jgi:phosphatidylglycerophosphate synthase
VIDPVALWVLPTLLKRPWVTPFRLTATAAVLGLLSAVSFGSGHLVLGAVLYELRFFVDCLDGKLARLRGMSSRRGAFFDFVCDVVLIGATVAALGWYLVERRGVSPALPFATVVLALVTLWLVLFDTTVPRTNAAGGAPDTASGRVGRFLAAHRLARAPWTVEAETLLLFLAPLTGSIGLLHAVLGLTSAYYTATSARLAVLLYRRLPAT